MVEELVLLAGLLEHVLQHADRLVDAVGVVLVAVAECPEEESLLHWEEFGCQEAVSFHELAVVHEAYEVLSADRVVLAVLDVSVGRVALEPAVDVVRLAPVGQKLVLGVSALGFSGEVHVESHFRASFQSLLDVPGIPPGPCDPDGSGCPPLEERRSFIPPRGRSSWR